MDITVWKNRVSLTADVYRRVNKDILLSRSLYSTTGFTSITQNLGKVENKGLEFLLDIRPFNRDLKWTVTFNIAFQKNKILSLYDSLQSLPSDASVAVGQSLGSHYLAVWAGVNPATGRGMWYDKNGNITYNPTAADRKFIGNIYPANFGGLTNVVSYKGFSVEAFFQYEYGRIRLDGQYQQMMRMGGATTNVIKSGYDARWQKPVMSLLPPVHLMAWLISIAWAGAQGPLLFQNRLYQAKKYHAGL
jgi:outer membrane receptor protein involved in Fe transport